MKMPFARKKLHLIAVGLACAGTIALITAGGCLNPAFVNQATGGSVVPLAPGDTPFVHVLVINATSASTLNFQFGWTPAFNGLTTAFLDGIAPQQQRGLILPCPVNQIGLGDPRNLNTPAIIITNANATYNVPAAAFPLVLANGRDFNCGDTVVITVIDDRNNGYGISVLPGRVDGATQTGPFSGPDTFEILDLLLMSSGSPPIPIP